MGKKSKHDVAHFEKILSDAVEACVDKAPSIKSSHRKGFVEACEAYHNGWIAAKQAEAELAEVGEEDEEAMSKYEKCGKSLEKSMNKAIKASNKIFDNLTPLGSEPDLELAILKGSIVRESTPEGLAEFCEADPKKHGKLIDALFQRADLMREMIASGGAAQGNYGMAMKIYTKIMDYMSKKKQKKEEEAGAEDEEKKEELDEETQAMLDSINKRIALAVSLEFATPINRFDTEEELDALERFKHYEKAHMEGDLDPSFPNFSAWEMRYIVNSDASNEDLKWGRDSMLAFAPYITAVTDQKWKYTYIVKTDVLMRTPKWESSPKTYPQILSGGGKEGPNAWYARFINKAFGIPVWEAMQGENGEKVGLTRWTPTGWEPMLDVDWDQCYNEFTGVSGADFKTELDARYAWKEEDYYGLLLLLQLFAELIGSRQGEIDEEEKGVLNPTRVWPSLAIIQQALMMVPATPEQFDRTREGLVKTKVEFYLEDYEADVPEGDIAVTKKGHVQVPVSRTGYESDLMMPMACQSGGKQINFLANGDVDYEMPENLEEGTYKISFEVCTVHAKKAPLFIIVDGNDDEVVEVDIPYTLGKYEKTKSVNIELKPSSVIRLSRKKPCFGMALKKITLKPKKDKEDK